MHRVLYVCSVPQVNGGALTLVRCDVGQFWASSGGAFVIYGGTVSIRDSVINDNAATGGERGGAFYMGYVTSNPTSVGYALLTLTDTELSRNRAATVRVATGNGVSSFDFKIDVFKRSRALNSKVFFNMFSMHESHHMALHMRQWCH